jgi:hypothetical protein
MTGKIAFLFTALVMAACGGNGISGTVGGVTLAPKEAIFFWQQAGQGQSGSVVISDQKDMCQMIKDGHLPKNTTAMQLVFSMNDMALTAETYPITATGSTTAGSEFYKFDGSCGLIVASPATSGTLKLTNVKVGTSAHASGTLDLHFGNDHVTGNFDAPYCDISFQTFLGYTLNHTCM